MMARSIWNCVGTQVGQPLVAFHMRSLSCAPVTSKCIQQDKPHGPLIHSTNIESLFPSIQENIQERKEKYTQELATCVTWITGLADLGSGLLICEVRAELTSGLEA